MACAVNRQALSSGCKPTRQPLRYPRFRRDLFARDVALDPGRVDRTSLNGIAHVAFDHNDSLRSREFIISWLNHTLVATQH